MFTYLKVIFGMNAWAINYQVYKNHSHLPISNY